MHASWCSVAQVYFSGIGRLKNVKAALRRGRLLRCSLCNQPGATIGCRVDRCPQNYHLVSSIRIELTMCGQVKFPAVQLNLASWFGISYFDAVRKF